MPFIIHFIRHLRRLFVRARRHKDFDRRLLPAPVGPHVETVPSTFVEVRGFPGAPKKELI